MLMRLDSLVLLLAGIPLRDGKVREHIALRHFLQVFGALRRIVFGFLAFILEINKHRLSTYNHVVACLVEAETATWQCILGTEEMIVNFLARSRSSLGAFVRVRRIGRSPESCLDFYDARDCFDEMLN